MKIYRYEIYYSNPEELETTVRLREFNVERETEYTYFIQDPRKYRLKQVRKPDWENANRFAYESKEDAMKHFIRRTKKRIGWYKYWLEECEKALEIAQTKGGEE